MTRRDTSAMARPYWREGIWALPIPKVSGHNINDKTSELCVYFQQSFAFIFNRTLKRKDTTCRNLRYLRLCGFVRQVHVSLVNRTGWPSAIGSSQPRPQSIRLIRQQARRTLCPKSSAAKPIVVPDDNLFSQIIADPYLSVILVQRALTFPAFGGSLPLCLASTSLSFIPRMP